jgi:hypothetical protein
MVRQTREMTPKNLLSDLIFKDECYSIVGACFEVYKNKGCGFHEPVELTDDHRAQVLNYLKASSFQLVLLINFGHYPKLQYERLANTQPKLRPDEPLYL